jgi:indole-3-glycerol phosphate synthase
MGANILDSIIAHKREEVAERKTAERMSELLVGLAAAPPSRDFAGALRDTSRPAPRVIAEIKRRSPSRGVLREQIDAAEVAAIYERNGAAAISVLCDSHFFGGSLSDLAAAREAVSIPALCKEFIVDEYQIVEACVAGADAVLLLASVLPTQWLRECRQMCEALGMAALVEVHDEVEMVSAIEAGAEIIGINNRDLRTFAVDIGTTASLLPKVPEGVIVVSESGIRSHADGARLGKMGVDAILVGEGLIAAPDIAAATRDICGLPPIVASRLEEASLR